MTTLGESLPQEIDRVTGLIPIYASVGPSSAIAIAMMRVAIKKAATAMAEGDLAAMIVAHEDLKGFRE